MNTINAINSSELPEILRTAQDKSLKAPPVPAEAARAAEAPRPETDTLSVDLAVANINSAIKSIQQEERQFLIDEDLGKLVVKIINADTKELIRQMPTEDALILSKKLQDIIGLMS